MPYDGMGSENRGETEKEYLKRSLAEIQNPLSDCGAKRVVPLQEVQIFDLGKGRW